MNKVIPISVLITPRNTTETVQREQQTLGAFVPVSSFLSVPHYRRFNELSEIPIF